MRAIRGQAATNSAGGGATSEWTGEDVALPLLAALLSARSCPPIDVTLRAAFRVMSSRSLENLQRLPRAAILGLVPLKEVPA